ncbi:MAG: bacterial Ig-like domain-containing protein, partial [Oscillospiraceae bacterium]
MTTKRKTQLKRAAISWLCVAVLVGGSVPAGLPGIIPAVTAAAEDVIAADHIINLAELANYLDGTTDCPTGIIASYGKTRGGNVYNSVIELTINESGTYKLTGSNYISEAYFDVKIIAAAGVNANIVCENAFIRNDDGTYQNCCDGVGINDDLYTVDRPNETSAVNYVVPFKAEAGAAITLSGTLDVDTFSIYKAWDYRANSYNGGNTYSYATPVSEGSGTVNTGAFSVVTYTDNNGGVIDRGYYLSAGENTYSADLADIWITSSTDNGSACGAIEKKSLSEMFECFGINGMKFNPSRITGDVTVECNETHTTEDGICDKDGYNFIIDLNKLGDYADGNTALPEIITAESSDNSITLTITQSGAYKLTGANTTDVQIYAASGVTADIVCDNAYIKNTNGYYDYETSNEGDDEDGFSGISSFYMYDYTYPFGTADDGQINLSGKLVVNTYTVDLEYHYQSTHFADEASHITADYTIVSYTINRYTRDEAFFLKGAEYDAADYAGEYQCINVEGKPAGEYKFTAGTDSVTISYYNDHCFDGGSDTCDYCGVGFTRYNITFEDGSENPATERVIENRTVARPWSDPTAPVGKQFTGWYTSEDCTTEYDFEQSVTQDITIYAGWEALPVQSVAVKTAPTKTSYIEGQKFDPAKLVIAVTYENGTLDVAYTDETKGDFTFAPAELSLGDTKVTITYGGESAEQDITVAKKQVTGIAIKTAPNTTSYIEGQKFDPAGLVITATYDNGKTENITYSDSTKDGFTFAPEELSLGDTKVTITYGGKSADQEITVAKKQLSSIAVKTPQTKTSYIEGEKYDPAGLVITLTYDNGKTEDVTYNDETKNGFTFTSNELSLNNAKVTITYGGKSV